MLSREISHTDSNMFRAQHQDYDSSRAERGRRQRDGENACTALSSHLFIRLIAGYAPYAGAYGDNEAIDPIAAPLRNESFIRVIHAPGLLRVIRLGFARCQRVFSP